MASSTRDTVALRRRLVGSGHSLRSDPALPRTLVELVLASSDAGTARPTQRGAGEPARRPLPRRLPRAIAAELPPNILYRRYPLVTSLLVELDELRGLGVPPPPARRGR